MSEAAVVVSLVDLKDGRFTFREIKTDTSIEADHSLSGNVPFSTLEAAFGPDSLGIIIVKDVPSDFVELRHRLLSYSSYLGNLPGFSRGSSPLTPRPALT
jgi:hypothetical protein